MKKIKVVLNCIFKPEIKQDGKVKVIRPLTLLHDLLGAKIKAGKGNKLQRLFVDKGLNKAGINIDDKDEVIIWLYEQTQWQMSNLTQTNNRKVIWEIFDDYRLTAQGDERPLWVV